MSDSKEARWWLVEDDVHEPLIRLQQQLQHAQSERLTWLEAMRCVYLDEPLALEARQQLEALSYQVPDIRSPWPALRCGVDAVHSKIAKTHPRGQVETIDGDWDLQCRAEMQTMWLDGMAYKLGLDELGERVFQDCEIYGTGCIYTGSKHDEPMLERTYVGDLMVDPQEEVHDAVRSLYRVRRMDVGVLCELFPAQAEAIKAAKKVDRDPNLAQVDGAVADIVLAVEAWRLADGPKSKGRHVIAVDGATLLDDREWKGDRFPFSFVHWSRDPRRFWGIGLVEQMLAPQSELDEIARTNSKARHLFVPCMFVPEGTQVEELDNEVGRIYRIPVASTFQPTVSYPGAIFQSMAMLEEAYIQRVFQLAGISELSAQSQKPAGLNSGKALQNFADIESERFAVANRSWERLFIDVCEMLISVARMICKGGASSSHKLEVMGGKEQLEAVSYADGDMGDHPSRIRVFPVSKLSDTISARLDEVERMVNAQMIDDMDDARELLDMPDLKRYNRIKSAGRRLVRKYVDKALRKGIASPVDPFMPLAYFIQYGSLSVNLAAEMGCPEANVQCLRDMVQFAIEMKAEQDAARAAATAPPAGAPMPPAGPPPGGSPIPMPVAPAEMAPPMGAPPIPPGPGPLTVPLPLAG